MITAEQAREMAFTTEGTVRLLMNQIEAKIEAAARVRLWCIDFPYPHEDILRVVQRELREAGYVVCGYSSVDGQPRGISIYWGSR